MIGTENSINIFLILQATGFSLVLWDHAVPWWVVVLLLGTAERAAENGRLSRVQT